MRVPLLDLTEERIHDLRAKRARAEESLDELRRTSAPELWLRELAALEEVLRADGAGFEENRARKGRVWGMSRG